MSELKPHEIQDLKGTIIESAIALLRLDPARGSFAIDHACRVAFGLPSSRVVLSDMRGHVATLIEVIQSLREIDINARVIAEDAIRIAIHSGLTPRRNVA
jgi:hypothetical protein